MPNTNAEQDIILSLHENELKSLTAAIKDLRREHAVEVTRLTKEIESLREKQKDDTGRGKDDHKELKGTVEKWEGRAWVFATAMILSLFGALLSVVGGIISVVVALTKK